MSAEFAGTLREQIVLERAVASRSPAGVLINEWRAFACCRAAVQPEGAGPEGEAMALSAMPRVRVTLRRREEVMVGQRMQWRERTFLVGQVIDDLRTPDRLVLRCEEVRT